MLVKISMTLLQEKFWRRLVSEQTSKEYCAFATAMVRNFSRQMKPPIWLEMCNIGFPSPLKMLVISRG